MNLAMDLEYAFNIGEAGLWGTMGVVMLVKALHAKGVRRRIFASLSAAFLFFGVSDVIEAHTGAWWMPLWLLIWKAVCFVWLALGFFHYYKTTKPSAAPAA